MKKKNYLAGLLVTAGMLTGTSCTAQMTVEGGKDSVLLNDEWLAPVHIVDDITCKTPPGLTFRPTSDSAWELKGVVPGKSFRLVLRPENGPWDCSEYSFFRVDLVNSGPGTVWIRGRLDNPGAVDWADSCPSSAVILPGEKAVLGFAYPRSSELNDAPAIFDRQSGKPNAHRTHWKPFDPANVISCNLQVESSEPGIQLEQIQVSMAQPYGVEANAKLMELPYLDRFGQVRLLDWPGKVSEDAALRIAYKAEQEAASVIKDTLAFNQYGGWAGGPQLKATGFFRTEKVDGKWWLVDPEGRLFFSHGVNDVSYSQQTPLEDRRELFEWLPAEEDPAMPGVIEKGKVYFMVANMIRTFGVDWKEPARERTHRRLRQWGMNTIGAWSDLDLVEDRKTPYTPIIYTWGVLGDGHHGVADPFADYFKENLQKNLRQLDRDNPWYLGVFIDNELGWVSPFVQKAFKLGANQPAQQQLLKWLKEKYETIESLNSAWKTGYASWESVQELPEGKNTSKAFSSDLAEMKVLIADEYYRVCKETMTEELPNHLYLGSRIHNAPSGVIRAAAKYVDVMSRNSYADSPSAGLVGGVDLPAMSTEFHFGSPDRGGLGVGLRPVGSQTQRARSYAAYLVSGLLDPHIVGTHWFAYSDQSAAGRPGENYQIGLVDVAGHPYEEFTQAVQRVGENMYPIRYGESKSVVNELGKIFDASSR